MGGPEKEDDSPPPFRLPEAGCDLMATYSMPFASLMEHKESNKK